MNTGFRWRETLTFPLHTQKKNWHNVSRISKEKCFDQNIVKALNVLYYNRRQCWKMDKKINMEEISLFNPFDRKSV